LRKHHQEKERILPRQQNVNNTFESGKGSSQKTNDPNPKENRTSSRDNETKEEESLRTLQRVS